MKLTMTKTLWREIRDFAEVMEAAPDGDEASARGARLLKMLGRREGFFECDDVDFQVVEDLKSALEHVGDKGRGDDLHPNTKRAALRLAAQLGEGVRS
jgi:hypothetical protein